MHNQSFLRFPNAAAAAVAAHNADPAAHGGTGPSGPVAAADITDASASGIVVLTGTPEQGREALKTAEEAIAFAIALG